MNSALLTIDDVPSSNTPRRVDYLREKGIQPILFAVGENIEKYYREALYAVQQGCILGNHSYSHPHFSALDMAECTAEIHQCECLLDQLYREAGIRRPCRPFRFPYGDKGGRNKDLIQRYLADHHFDKVDDRHIPYSWWKKYGMDRDIDTFWTFDFEEYRLAQDPDFTMQQVWNKMNDPTPSYGAALFSENHRHILLMHDFDETETVMPGYYRVFLDYLLDRGMIFDKPTFQ